MAQAAVRRSKGQCEAFWGEYAGDDDFLLYLGNQIVGSLWCLRNNFV
uniref:Uncharacterized protein n=1 Tax=Aegilops tauschii subsp. strangulata TaxID=200361 RepID=A0A453RYW5_AEGTS